MWWERHDSSGSIFLSCPEAVFEDSVYDSTKDLETVTAAEEE